jgi:phosphate transport system protein
MGGLVEIPGQRRPSTRCREFSGETADQVLRDEEERVNQMEVEIDRDAVGHHRPPPAHRARPAPADRDQQDDRQPGARGRRGSAHRAHGAASDHRFRPAEHGCACRWSDLKPSRPTWPARSCARRWMPSRGWTPMRALEVLKQDDQIDEEFDGLLRKLITYMMEDPRTISASIDLVFVAKAIERVGDHAKNLAEAIIYVVKGTDVRHSALEHVESITQ